MASSSMDFDSKEFDYPLDGSNHNKLHIRRSAMKKPGQSRAHNQNSSMLLKVSFNEVHLREYGMVLGDNPAVSHGAPVQLDWEPQEMHDPVHIDNYEKARSLRRAKDRRGFLLNAHKRVKILFAAGYTIDEIAKATMEMKEYRQLRADSLKTQGMMTGAIMALLSGAAETTGQTVRTIQILPNALAGAGKVMLNGTSKAVVGAGTEMMGLTNKVVAGTANAAKRTGTVVTGAATQVTKGTGQVVVGTGKLMVKGTTGVVKGTSKVVVGTGKVGMDVVKGTGKVGMDVVKGTGNVMKGSTKAMVQGTGVLFTGTANMMKGTSKRLSRMVSGGTDSSSSTHDHRRGRLGSDGMDESDRSSSRRIFDGFKIGKNGRTSLSVKALPPKPTGSLTRQRSLDSARAATSQNSAATDLNEELLEMQDFLAELDGMDKSQVKEMLEAERVNPRGASLIPLTLGSARSLQEQSMSANQQ